MTMISIDTTGVDKAGGAAVFFPVNEEITL